MDDDNIKQMKQQMDTEGRQGEYDSIIQPGQPNSPQLPQRQPPQGA
jgi:hypothetical protein